jgi:hypothetical protein
MCYWCKIIFLHEWKQNLQAQANGKLLSYVLFKSNFGCAKYLSVINNIDIRKQFTKLLYTSYNVHYMGTDTASSTCPMLQPICESEQ